MKFLLQNYISGILDLLKHATHFQRHVLILQVVQVRQLGEDLARFCGTLEYLIWPISLQIT